MDTGKFFIKTALLLWLVALSIVSCGSKEPEIEASAPQNFLLETSMKTALKRVGEIRTYVGQTLWEYINGGAEIYYLYDFESVATADYKDDGVEIVVDIYKFRGGDNAFGLYSMLRPVDAQLVRLGVEGFVAPGLIAFVKGDYVVKLIGFDDSPQSSLALINLAEELGGLVPGRVALPEIFTIFPGANAIAASRKCFAESYLGQKFLTEVYSQSYIMGTDTLGLFLSEDADGAKFAHWMEIADKTANMEAIKDSLGFDESYSFRTTDRFYGDIIVGLKDGYLAGAVGYRDNLAGFIRNWLAGI